MFCLFCHPAVLPFCAPRVQSDWMLLAVLFLVSPPFGTCGNRLLSAVFFRFLLSLCLTLCLDFMVHRHVCPVQCGFRLRNFGSVLIDDTYFGATLDFSLLYHDPAIGMCSAHVARVPTAQRPSRNVELFTLDLKKKTSCPSDVPRLRYNFPKFPSTAEFVFTCAAAFVSVAAVLYNQVLFSTERHCQKWFLYPSFTFSRAVHAQLSHQRQHPHTG